MRVFAKEQSQKPRADAMKRKHESSSAQPLQIAAILQLQRTLGNQAVQRLYRSRTRQPADHLTKVASASTWTAEHRTSSNKADRSKNRRQDPQEREADRLARQATRIPPLQTLHPDRPPEISHGLPANLSARTARKPEHGHLPPHVKDAIRSPGEPLDAATRVSAESLLEYDFSGVRVHNETRGAESARAVNALAYTAGNHIVFGAGRYRPTTPTGRRLLFHELAHVKQQRHGTGLQRKPDEDSPADEDTSHVIECPDPEAVSTALDNARIVLEAVVDRLQNGPSNIPVDRRAYTPMHYFYTLFFHVEPGDRSMGQILQIKEAFRYLLEALSSVRTQCVSADNPHCQSGDFQHSAYAPIGPAAPRVLSMCPAFFNNSPDEQARTIIHELAHNRLGVGHGGGRFVMFGCQETPVSTFDEAIDNAYVYDGFAYCLYAATSRSEP